MSNCRAPADRRTLFTILGFLSVGVPVALLVTLLHLLVSQRHHRIHLSRAPHGDVHRRQCDHSQQRYRHTVGGKIKRTRLKGRSR